MSEDIKQSPKREEVDEPVSKKPKVEDKVRSDDEDEQKPSTSTPKDEDDATQNENMENKENPNLIKGRPQSRQSLLELKELYKEPTFAEICSFINIFGVMMGIKSMPFTKMESLFVFDEDGKAVFRENSSYFQLIKKWLICK